MKANFKMIMTWLAGYEGGYVNHPKDPGGATNRGVTQRVYDAYRRAQGNQPQSVRHLLDEEHDEIYLQQYWNPVWGNQLPHGIDASVFDMAVHSGVSRAMKTLQRLLGVSADGVIGFITMTALQKATGTADGLIKLIKSYNERRHAFLKRLKTYATFGTGWRRRVIGAKAGSQEGDYGVIDRAVVLARLQNKGQPNRQQTIVMAPSRKPSEGRATDNGLGKLSALFEAIADALSAAFGRRPVVGAGA